MALRHAFPLLATCPQQPRLVYEVLKGLDEFQRTGSTPPSSYKAMIRLFLASNGRSNEALHTMVARKETPPRLPHSSGLLGDLDQREVGRVADTIREDGFCVAERHIPDDAVASLEAFARSAPAFLRPPLPDGPERAVYSEDDPISGSYRFSEEQVANHPTVQALMTDPFILSVAANYLGCTPIYDILSMWWNVKVEEDRALQNELAQHFHFDMDRIKWLKVMMYLTDVDADSGPHCFITGTHRAGSQPSELRKRGYDRITDEDLARHYPRDRFAEICGRRGSIVFVDTRGYHKGKRPVARDRLLLQFSLCDSLFGAPAKTTPVTVADEAARKTIAALPQTFSRLVRQ